MKHLLCSLRYLTFMTILTGFIYPFSVTGIAQFFFPKQAQGSLVSQNGKIIGSKLIAQNFSSPSYFWPRPSSIKFDPRPSGATNLGPTSTNLKEAVEKRLAELRAANPDQTGAPPQDLIFASGSGLDPHISPAAARYQVPRIAKSRQVDENQILNLIDQMTVKRLGTIFGEPVVNVLELNLALDRKP